MDPAITISPRGGLRGLLDELGALHARGEIAVLGIVVATSGSTYQKPGALVLLDRHGLRHGVISGGCLEPELEQRSEAVFAQGRAALIQFDTRSDEDLVFGSGTGCRGRVQLLLLPQPPRAALAQALRECTEHAAELELRLVLHGVDSGAGVATFGANSTMRHVAWDARGVDAAQPAAVDVVLHIAAPPRVLLLGAGPETPPLLEFARRLGWHASVIEHRGRWAAFARAGGAERLLDRAPAEASAAISTERADAIIVMSHNYAIDLQHLRFCAQSDTGYIGLLGPPARRDALLAELGSQAHVLRPRLHAPVGLDLGGSGPEAIALAIAAQLQQHFTRGRDA